jgi:hypothetical protein
MYVCTKLDIYVEYVKKVITRNMYVCTKLDIYVEYVKKVITETCTGMCVLN